MLNFKFDHKKGLERLEVCGDVEEIVADVAVLLSVLYGTIKSKNSGAADTFKKCVCGMGFDRDMRNHVFSDKLAKELGIIEKKPEEDKRKEEVVELLSRLISVLDEDDSDDDDDDDDDEEDSK